MLQGKGNYFSFNLFRLHININWYEGCIIEAAI
jgi:hypothetical protein